MKKFYLAATLVGVVVVSSSAVPINIVKQNLERKIIYQLEDDKDTKKDIIKELKEDIQLVLQYEPTFSCEHIDICSDFELKEHREELRNYYKLRNETLISQLDFRDYGEVYASAYGPFITYTYDSMEQLYHSDVGILEEKNSSDLVNVFIELKDKEDQATRNTSSSSYDFSQALLDIGISNPTATGKGIKVGSIESGIPNNYSNLTGKTYETYGTHQTSHAFQTSSVYGGTSGIARDVQIYFACLANYNFSECVDWLISKNVNIINRSNGAATGTYNSRSAYADYIVKETKVSFINSAGNIELEFIDDAYIENKNIADPSTGLNVISVASSDVNKGISYFSCTELDTYEATRLLKPTLTAPGGNITSINNISGGLSGTSFSAPMVTGVVALLMEEFGDLKYHPEAVMSLLCNTTTNALGQTEIVDYDAGFGIVNYANARNVYTMTKNKTIPSNVNANVLLSSESISLSSREEIKVTTSILYNSTCTSPFGLASILNVSFSKLRIELIDKSSNKVIATSTSKSNFSYLKYKNNLVYKDCLLNVYLLGSKVGTGIESYALNITSSKLPHSHSYLWTYYDNISHRNQCLCGDYIDSGNHRIYSNDPLYSQNKGTCLDCRRELDFRYDVAEVIRVD